MNGSGPPFYGKFRGKVTDNRDPDKRGRLRLKVPDIYGEEESGWALPASPYAGNGVGLFLIPPTEASVWAEFEQGNPDYPIWSGCFWDEDDESPVSSQNQSEMKVLKTDTATITLNDQSGESSVTIETTAGMKIKIDSNGIEINNGQASIKLSGSQVSINNGALEVT